MNIIPYQFQGYEFLPHDPAIATVYEGVAKLLKAEIPYATIEHIGSTAVPGLGGKNSLNMLVIVDPDKQEEAAASMERKGFTDHPFKRGPFDHYLKVCGVESENKCYFVHAHVVEKFSQGHLAPLFFRDYLTQHPEEAKRYADLKRLLVESGAESELYNKEKQTFFQDIISRNPKNLW
jgi:GrpB-like predicted nucleotidyltransferase (UPF0157 family)